MSDVCNKSQSTSNDASSNVFNAAKNLGQLYLTSHAPGITWIHG